MDCGEVVPLAAGPVVAYGGGWDEGDVEAGLLLPYGIPPASGGGSPFSSHGLEAFRAASPALATAAAAASLAALAAASAASALAYAPFTSAAAAAAAFAACSLCIANVSGSPRKYARKWARSCSSGTCAQQRRQGHAGPHRREEEEGE